MRKLVDAPRKKKQWTEKEEAYLQDKWGTVSIKGLSKALGRSENAIIVRAQRLGCGAHLAGDTRISLNQLMLAIYGKNMLGYTSDRLIRYGLPVKWHVVKKNRFRVIDIDAFSRPAQRSMDEDGRRQAPVPAQQRDIYIQRPGSRAETFRRSHQAQDPRPWNQ